MKQYLRSSFIAGLAIILSAGIGVLFAQGQPLAVRLLLCLACLAMAGGGIYLLFFHKAMQFSSLEGQKITASLLLRSLVVALGAIYFFILLYKSSLSMLPMLIIMATMAVSFTLLFFYHIYLFIRQNAAGK